MSWNSGPCNGPDSEPEEHEERGEKQPRMVWGGATNFMGAVDRVNPGHFERPRTDGDGTSAGKA